jgi:hypothetical protein
MLDEMRRLLDHIGFVVVDAFVFTEKDDHVGGQTVIQLNEPWL